MLIHLGDNEVLSLDSVIAIINLKSIDPTTAAQARAEVGAEAKAAVLVDRPGSKKPGWIGSLLSSYTLWERGHRNPIPGTLYRRRRRASMRSDAANRNTGGKTVNGD